MTSSKSRWNTNSGGGLFSPSKEQQTKSYSLDEQQLPYVDAVSMAGNEIEKCFDMLGRLPNPPAFGDKTVAASVTDVLGTSAEQLGLTSGAPKSSVGLGTSLSNDDSEI